MISCGVWHSVTWFKHGLCTPSCSILKVLSLKVLALWATQMGMVGMWMALDIWLCGTWLHQGSQAILFATTQAETMTQRLSILSGWVFFPLDHLLQSPTSPSSELAPLMDRQMGSSVWVTIDVNAWARWGSRGLLSKSLTPSYHVKTMIWIICWKSQLLAPKCYNSPFLFPFSTFVPLVIFAYLLNWLHWNSLITMDYY